jgi:hypothetical protein
MTAPIIERLRADLLAGRIVRILDVPREQRPEAIAALAVLRDELPIRTSWRTVSSRTSAKPVCAAAATG